jgi:hypothetical protein
MDDHAKDSKKSPMYQFQLLITEIEIKLFSSKNPYIVWCGFVVVIMCLYKSIFKDYGKKAWTTMNFG